MTNQINNGYFSFWASSRCLGFERQRNPGSVTWSIKEKENNQDIGEINKQVCLTQGSNPSVRNCSWTKRTGSAASWGAVRRSLVSATTALSASELKVALAWRDTPSTSGSVNRLVIAEMITIEIVANTLLCDQKKSHIVLLEAKFTSYTFPDQ